MTPFEHAAQELERRIASGEPVVEHEIHALLALRNDPIAQRVIAYLIRQLRRRGAAELGASISAMGIESGEAVGIPRIVGDPPGQPGPEDGATVELLLQAQVVVLGGSVPDGRIIEAVALPWHQLVAEFDRDPELMFQCDPWKLEQIVAAGYAQAGFDVVLTPRSGDLGKDVIATSRDGLKIRVFDQVKRYARGHRVTAEEVRAMLWTVQSHHDVSKGFVTTTSTFAPGVYADPTISPYVPHRLELREGQALRTWLSDIAQRK